MSPQVKTPEEGIPLENYFPNVPRGTIQRIEAFGKLFWDWNHHINLTGEKSYSDFFHQQILDCISGSEVSTLAEAWIDVGSGGGLPGLIWALLFPQKEFLLVESQQKKVSFLNRAVSELKIKNVRVLGGRFEELSSKDLALKNVATPNIVSRGTASPPELLQLAAQAKFPWQQWFVFSSEKTNSEFLTLCEKFGMKAKSAIYSRRVTLGPGKEGLFTILERLAHGTPDFLTIPYNR